MKRFRLIALLLWVGVAACTPRNDVAPSVETRQGTSLPTEASPALANIDSLMWRQPDSALVCLLSYFDTCCRDALNASQIARRIQCVSTTTFDDHYAQLLAAELLYKNDYQQTNRTDLLQAVAYFDSLVREIPPFKGARGITSDPNLFFLAARAHYINGVGYYEQDSVVPACQQYLKALEIMEGHFAEKELVGKKAKFMALTYAHLTTLFSDLYLHEQAICFVRLSLQYYQKCDVTPWHVAWTLNIIGSHYEMMELLDSADCYYRKALIVAKDSTMLIYRDIATHQAFLSYKKDKDVKNALSKLHELSRQAESEREFLSCYAIIGEIFYHEGQNDSAWFYLNKVFRGNSSIGSKKQAAEWLVNICKIQGKNDEILEFADFLVPFANVSETQANSKSQLTELYLGFEQSKHEAHHRQQMKKNREKAMIVIGILLGGITIVFVLYFINKKYNRRLQTEKEETDKQLASERQAHKTQQAALSGRLKRSNEALRIQKEATENLLKELERHQKQSGWGQLEDFLEESICKEILTTLQGKEIKREAKHDDYPELHLSVSQLSQLNTAVENHFSGFGKKLADLCPRINCEELNQCQLYLLSLDDVQIAALLDRDYSTVKKRSTKLKKAFGTEKELAVFIRAIVL